MRRDWGAWLSLARRSKPSAHPLNASRHSNLSTHSQTLTPSGFPNGASCTGRGANAPPPTQVPPIGCREFVLGTSNRNGIRIMDLPVPSCLRSSCQKLLRCLTNFGSRAPGRFRKAMSRFVASASRPEVSSILPCAADFCLMSKPALPANETRMRNAFGAVSAPGRRHDERPDPRNAPGLQVFL